MCNITISGYTATPISATQTNVTVTGTASSTPGTKDCAEVQVEILCGGVALFDTVPVTSGSWSATITTGCLCGETINIAATCVPNNSCSDSISAIMVCNCCPEQVTINHTTEPCNPATGTVLVNYSVTFTVPPQCSITARIDFGNGNFSPTNTYAAGVHTITASETYTPNQTVNVCLDVISPTGCPPVCVPVVIPPCGCCPQVKFTASVGACDPATGTTPVTFTGTIIVPVDCRVTAQISFGDGTFSPTHTAGAGTYNFTEIHNYPGSGGTYNVCIDILSPEECKPTCITIVVPPCTPECCPTISGLKVSPPGPCINGESQVTLTATVTPNPNCPTTTVEVQWNYGDGNYGPVVTITGPTTFNETHNYLPGTYNACLIVISPSGGCPSPCITVTIPPCSCCPKLSLTASVGTCNQFTNTTPVTFAETIVVPAGCTTSVRINFGDGSMGISRTLTGGSYSFTEVHNYSGAGGTFTACLNVISPKECPPACTTFNVQPCNCCPTISNLSYKQGACIDLRGDIFRTITLSATVTPNPICPGTIEVVWDYGDGNYSAPILITGTSPVVVTDVHNYISSSTPYNACLIVIIPSICPSACISVLAYCPPCCPSISINAPSLGSCDPTNGNFTATITYTVSVPAVCPPAVVQWSDSLGHNGVAQTYFPGTTTTVTVNETYSTSNTFPITFSVFVISPGGCPSQSVTINKPTGGSCDCQENCLKRIFCPILLNIIFAGLAIGIACLLLLSCPALLAISSSVSTFLVVLGVVGLAVALIALYFYCHCCKDCAKCKWWFYLLLFQVLWTVGSILAIFSGCCGGLGLFVVSLVLMAVGLIFLVLWAIKCNQTFCQAFKQFLIATAQVISVVGSFILIIGYANIFAAGCFYMIGTATFWLIYTTIAAFLTLIYLFICP